MQGVVFIVDLSPTIRVLTVISFVDGGVGRKSLSC